MLSAQIEPALALIELQCEAVAAAVQTGEPRALEQASQALRQTAVDFSALLEQLGGPAQASPGLTARLQKLATALGHQRESLLRRSALVERSLHTLVPSLQERTTYAPAGRASAYRGFAS